MAYRRIEECGIIGNLHTAALVATNGSIDFLCFPRFDSPTLFAELLDEQRGGSFAIAPVGRNVKSRQFYLTGSNVLVTRFFRTDGIAELSDFMPIDDHFDVHGLVRRVEAIRGAMTYRMRCRPRFDYARVHHRIERTSEGILFIPTKRSIPPVRLRSSIPVQVRNGGAWVEFSLHAGESAWFLLEEAHRHKGSPSGETGYAARSFHQTLTFWRKWIAHSQYTGRWQEMVDRSALLLKLLTYEPSGSLVAAPTFGLPEVIGGERNWDYRYTWIRDASLTLLSLLDLGYVGEAKGFFHWIAARCDEVESQDRLQIAYGIDGRQSLTEHDLPHLAGYKNSRPVRTGNGAYTQRQLDIYGELMEAVNAYDRHGHLITRDLWQGLVTQLNWVCQNWRAPGEGFWEVRGGRQCFLVSRVMCWVALDRGIRLATRHAWRAPLERWKATRAEIHRDVIVHFWNPERQAFMQYQGANELDAAALRIPLVGFLPPGDPRWLSTLHAIEQDLIGDVLVQRYRADKAAPDGFRGVEGTFNMLSFWYAEALSRSGEVQKARQVFEKMLGYANHVGLYSEELGRDGAHLGNFPQAMSHLGLISAAYAIDRQLSRSEKEVNRSWRG